MSQYMEFRMKEKLYKRKLFIQIFLPVLYIESCKNKQANKIAHIDDWNLCLPHICDLLLE